MAGTSKEVATVSLVCPDPRWKKGVSFLTGTNSSIFQVLAQYCRQQASPGYQKQLRMHTPCAEAYARWEKRGMKEASSILGALWFSRRTPLTLPAKIQWALPVARG